MTRGDWWSVACMMTFFLAAMGGGAAAGAGQTWFWLPLVVAVVSWIAWVALILRGYWP